MPRTSTPLARWGLLITNLLMGALLVATGLNGFFTTRQAADEVLRARGADLLFATRRALIAAGSLDPATLEEELQMLRTQGVTFVGVLDAGGDPVATAGQPADALGTAGSEPLDQGPSTSRMGPDGRVRVVDTLVPGRRKGGCGMGRCECSGMGCHMRRGMMDKRLVVEFEPVLADQMLSRALLSLVVSLAAAALLLGAAWVFWRLSRRSERIAAQLERDRRLAALGEMSAVLGHELRNPLASLKGHAQLLVEKLPADHPALSGAERVVSEAIRLESLTGQVLDFVRTGGLRIEPVAVGELLREVASGLDGDRVRVEVADDLDAWPMDRERMRQVLVNLTDNALQASAEEDPVEIEATRDGDWLVVQVLDLGPGVAEDDLERIFEPFHSGKVRGTGLGLVVARRIVESHGGRIHAASRQDRGTLFRFRLPGA